MPIFRLAIVPALFLTLLYTSSCEKDDGDDKEQPGYKIHISVAHNTTVDDDITDVKTGWLHNYELCNDLATAKYNQDGFYIYLPKTVADTYLTNISEYMKLEQAPDVASDHDAKWVLINCFRGYNGNTGKNSTLECSTAAIPRWAYLGGGKVCFVYVDRDVKLDGTAETLGFGTYHWDDVKLKKGWTSVAYLYDGGQYYFALYDLQTGVARWGWETWY